MTLSIGQRLMLRIVADGDEGFGVARHEGAVVFVQGALRGEWVHAELYEVRKRFAKAQVVSLEEASPHRRIPPCPFYEACGGCCMQHMDYAYATEVLQAHITGCMERIGGVPPGSYALLPALVMAKPFHYRNKAVFHAGGGSIGYKRRSSGEVADIGQCLLLPEALNNVLSAARAYKGAFGSVMARVSRAGGVMAMMDAKLFMGEPVLHDVICGLKVRLSAGAFQQVNPSQADRLYQAVLEQAGEGALCVDAYCGGGLLSMLLARRFHQVVGIEIADEAVKDAESGARLNGVDNAAFIRGAVEDVLPGVLSAHGRPDCLVFDPPRAGVDMRALDAVIRAGIDRVVYVSCDPATLARDVKVLAGGGYRLDSLRMVDMFPWTGHVESVGVLLRKDTQRCRSLLR